MTRQMLVGLVVLAMVGCSKGPIQSFSAPGTATVEGQVLQRSGQPLAQSSVAVECRQGDTSPTVPTDSAGRYAVNLMTPTPGVVRCEFAVPSLAAPRIRVDTTIVFAPSTLPHALQVIDLREP